MMGNLDWIFPFYDHDAMTTASNALRYIVFNLVAARDLIRSYVLEGRGTGP